MSAIPEPLFARLATGGSAVAWTQGLRLACRLVSMVALARLLTPNEFGVFGMAALVFGVLQTVRDFGLGTVAVQQGEMTPTSVSAFFWLQAGAGLLVTLLACAIAPLAATLFAEPALAPLLCALSAAFLCNGLGGQFRVELSRRLRFRTLSLVDLTGLAGGIALAIALAAHGAGPWSLVGMVLLQELIVLGGLALASPWRPGGPADFSGTARLIRSGLHLAGFNLTQFCAQMIDQACVALRLGPQALGLYGRAWQVGTLPTHGLIAGLSNWMVQGLVKLRDDPSAFRIWCGHVLNALAYGCNVLAAILLVAPETVLACLLGPQWSAAAPALRWLALTLPLQPWLFAELWILGACRQERRLLAWSLARLVALAAALAVGGSGGIAAIAASVTLAQWVLLPGSIAVVASASPFAGRDLARANGRPIVLGAVVGAALLLVKSAWGDASPWTAAGAIALTVGLAVAAFAALLPRGRGEIVRALNLLRGRAA